MCSTLQPGVLELQCILRQAHWITLNDSEHYDVKGTTYTCMYVLLVPMGPNFTPFRHMIIYIRDIYNITFPIRPQC